MTETLELHVRGMTCGGCENAVKTTLAKLYGIDEIKASHALERVDVKYDPAKLTRELIKNRIEALGYSVGS